MKKYLILSVMIAAISLTACNTGVGASNSNQSIVQWRGVDRSGIYTETGLKTSWGEDGPPMLWYFNGLGYGYSSPVAAGDRIFVTGMENGIGTIFVFDTRGNLVNSVVYGPEWTRNYDGVRGSITPYDGRLYLISGYGVIYCFDQRTLNLIWSRNLLEDFNAPNIRWGITESPLIVGDKVIATPGGTEHNVVALNRHNGQLIWSTPGMGNQSSYTSPMFIGTQQVPLVVQMTGHHTLGIHAETGEMLWSFPNTNQHQMHGNTPIYSNGMVLITSGYGRGSTMLRLTNGGRSVEEVWHNQLLDNQQGGMVKVGNYVFGSGHASRRWFATNWNTGEIVWEASGEAMGVTIANNDMLYIYTDRGDMILARATPERFDIVSRFRVPFASNQHWAHPIIYNGVLYIRHKDTLMAFNIKQ